jgi:fatty acid desaturase
VTLSPALPTTEPIDRPGPSAFSPLLDAVRNSGLLRLRRRWYAVVIATDLLAFAAVWAAVWTVGNTWWQILLAIPAAIFTVRMIFVGHDVGHRQVARTKRVNTAIGVLVGDVIVGLGSRWWIDKHSRHHANPNEVGRDPDVGAGALAWTPDQAAARPGALAWLNRNQGRLFFPMLLGEAFNLHVGSMRLTRGARDLTLMLVHVAAYLGLLVFVMGPGKAAVFVLAHQALVGLHLGCAFAPNHKGMPMPPPGSRWDFLSKQVLTTRNVRGGPVTDWFLGGLNYQIEHHLFPSMPRPNLRRVQAMVKSYCAGIGMPYAEESLRTSLVLTVRHLQSVGRSG